MEYGLCKRGHVRSPQNVGKDRSCKLCRRITQPIWIQENKTHRDEIVKLWGMRNASRAKENRIRWDKANPEARNKINEVWRGKNKDKRRAASAKWRRENPNKVKAQEVKRRGIKSEASGVATAKQIKDRVEYSETFVHIAARSPTNI